MKKPQQAGTKSATGTVRWPANCEAAGQFIKLPKVLIKRLAEFDIQPHHLWLLLRLQCDRFEGHPPRAYWAALAAECGRGKDAVRKWGYELRDKGLLRIQQNRRRDAEDADRHGWRNDRNSFHLDPFLAKAHEVQRKWMEEKEAKAQKKGGR